MNPNPHKLLLRSWQHTAALLRICLMSRDIADAKGWAGLDVRIRRVGISAKAIVLARVAATFV